MKRIVYGAIFLWPFLTVAQEMVEIETLKPESVHKPLGQYSMAKLVPANAQWLVTAGQIGVNLKGEIVEGIDAQADWAMKNLYNMVKAADMDRKDVLKMTIFYTDRSHLRNIMSARNKYFGDDFAPGSTAVVVKSLANEKLLVEVEALAAKVTEN